MKYINLNGQTLPEMLKSMQSKINELIEHYSMLRAYATSENYINDETIYQISALSFSEGFENGTIVVFTKNAYIGVARNVDIAAGTYYVESVGTIKGSDGATGQTGEEGNGIVEISGGTPTVNGEYTFTPINVSLTKTPEQNFDVAAKNGNGIVSAHSLSHRTEGDEEITTVELVTDDGTNPKIEIHAKNGTGVVTKKYAHLLHFSYISLYVNVLVFSAVSTPFTNLTEALAAMTAGEKFLATGVLYRSASDLTPISYVIGARPRLPSQGAPALILDTLDATGMGGGEYPLSTYFSNDNVTEL